MIEKNTLIVIALVLLISSVIIGVPTLYRLNVMVVGAEGVDVGVHGVEWTPPNVQQGGLKTTSGARPQDLIGFTGDPNADYGGEYTTMVWGRPEPFNPSIKKTLKHRYWFSEWVTEEKLSCQVRISKPSVQQINIHGDPLGVRGPVEIQWYKWTSITREEQVGDTTEIEWTRYEAFVVPVDFIFEVSVRALQDGSWGTFEDLHLWLVLDTKEWYDAFTKPYGSVESNDEAPEGADLKSYNYRGAFPIWAWIGEWDRFVKPTMVDENGDTVEDNDIPDEMDEYLQIEPSFGGSRLPLFHEPNWEYEDVYAKDMYAKGIVKDDSELGNKLESEIAYLPDPRFAETVFTPITLEKYGALKQSDGWGPFYWENYYYPTTYIRVRCLYAVWGEWIYLWTQQEADDQGYEWENRTSIIYRHESQWNQFWGGIAGGLGALFSNPLFWLTSGMIGLFIVIVLILVFAPKGFTTILEWVFRRKKR